MKLATSEERCTGGSPTVWIARGLLVLWAGFWLWFNVASGISEVPAHGWGALAGHILTALVVLGAGLAAWFWPRVGGWALLALGAAMGVFFDPNLVVAALLILPPMVIGVLMVLEAHRPVTPPA